VAVTTANIYYNYIGPNEVLTHTATVSGIYALSQIIIITVCSFFHAGSNLTTLAQVFTLKHTCSECYITRNIDHIVGYNVPLDTL